MSKNNYIQIVNGNILTPDGWLRGGSVIIKEKKILEVTNSDLPRVGATIVDAKGQYVVPGFVAFNVFGGGGRSFNECTRDAFDTVVNTHLRHGATTIFPTISLSEKNDILKAAKLCEEYVSDSESPVCGLHVVGPYLNPALSKNLFTIKDFNPSEYREIINSTSCIKRWDASPGLQGAYNFARTLKKHNILTAITHTDIGYEAIKGAYIAGFTHAALFYNSMVGFHKKREYKYEGTIESVYLVDDMTVEVVADGKHLPPTILKLVYKLKGVERTCLVTAALSYADYNCPIENDSNIIIDDGVCKLKDHSSLVGSIATMDTLIKTMVFKADIPLEDAVRMASETPAKLMNCWDRIGSIEHGKDADIVILNKDLDIVSIWQLGKEIHL